MSNDDNEMTFDVHVQGSCELWMWKCVCGPYKDSLVIV
jgi:hypothetical protein